MDYVTVERKEMGHVGSDTPVKGKDGAVEKGPPPPLVHAHGQETRQTAQTMVQHQVPKVPVYMDDDEIFVDYRKPGFWSYTPAVAMFFFGLILFVLFLAGGGVLGLIIGGAIFGGMMYVARYKLWVRTGYWFTNHKIVYHDGSKIRLIPYDEIALSTLAFEGENCMFSTVYNQEIILKGIIDMEQVVAYISKRVKEERKKGNGGPR